MIKTLNPRQGAFKALEIPESISEAQLGTIANFLQSSPAVRAIKRNTFGVEFTYKGLYTVVRPGNWILIDQASGQLSTLPAEVLSMFYVEHPEPPRFELDPSHNIFTVNLGAVAATPGEEIKTVVNP